MRYLSSKRLLTAAGGLAAGLTAMYLLDPNSGQRRRAAIARAAQEAGRHGGDYLHGHLHGTGEAIRQGAAAAGQRIGDWTGSARRAGQQAMHAAGQAVADATAAAPAAASTDDLQPSAAAARGMHRLIDSYHDSAEYLADRVDRLRHAMESGGGEPARPAPLRAAGQALWNPLLHGAQSAMHSAHSAFAHLGRGRGKLAKRSLLLVPITLGGVACVAAGAGAMYWFDPDLGRRRRIHLRNRAVGMVGAVGRFARHRGRNVRGNVRAMAREVGLAGPRRISSRDYVSGEQLLLRVRERLSRVSSSPRTIQVMTDTDGAVTLTGQAAADERQQVLTAVRQTPGVRQVVDRLTPQAAK